MASSGSPKHSVVIAVGDELLRGHTLDSNTNWLAQRLYTLGFPVRRVHIVSDVQDEIVAAVRGEMALEPTCLFLCGGLGPTPDDRTLAALAVALERPLRVGPPGAPPLPGPPGPPPRLRRLQNPGAEQGHPPEADGP